MTFLKNGEFTGFFDVFSSGIYVDKDWGSKAVKSRDDNAIWDLSIYVHELTHYLQFLGSSFGLSFFLKYFQNAKYLKEFIKRTSSIRNKMPFSMWQYEFKDDEIANNLISEEADYARRFVQWYLEEIEGMTFTQDASHIPIISEYGKRLISSPLHFISNDHKGYFSVVGKSILENHASCMEGMYVGLNTDEDQRERITAEKAASTSIPTFNFYNWFLLTIHQFEIEYYENLFHFVVMNQDYEGPDCYPGDYKLVSNIKKILYNTAYLRKSLKGNRMKSKEDVIEAANIVAKITNLQNPFDVITEKKRKLNSILEKANKPPSQLVVISMVFEWILEEPREAIFWAANPDILSMRIPIFGLYLKDEDYRNVVHFPISFEPTDINDKETIKSELEQHHKRMNPIINHLSGSFNFISKEMGIVCLLSFYGSSRCPYYNPSLYKKVPHCKHCKKVLPTNGLPDDCPVIQNHSDLNLNNADWNAYYDIIESNDQSKIVDFYRKLVKESEDEE